MKHMTKLVTVTIALGYLLAATAVQAEARVATVNVSRLVDNYWKTRSAKAALDARKADLEKEGKAMITEFRKNESEYTALLSASLDQAVSDSEREKKRKESEEKKKVLREQNETIAKFQKTANETLDDQAGRILTNVLGDVKKAIEAKARTAGYALVLDNDAKSVVGTPVIMFNSGDLDITEEILQQLNSTAPPEAVAATETKPDTKPAPKK